MNSYIPNEKEELLKTQIHNAYLKFFNESSSDRRKVNFAIFLELTNKWCRYYLYNKINKKVIEIDGIQENQANFMGEEIYIAVNRICKKTDKPILKDKNHFIKHLVTYLKAAKKEFFRNHTKLGSMHIPRITIEIKKYIEYKESNLGRNMTLNEKIHFISRSFILSEKTAEEYLLYIAREKFDSIEFESSDDNNTKMSSLDFEASKQPYMDGRVKTPEDKIIEKYDRQTIMNAVKNALEKTQIRTKKIKIELFTLDAIKRMKDYECFRPILDTETIELFEANKEKGKILAPSDIYLKYHPKATHESAEASASTLLNSFHEKCRFFLEKEQ